MKTSFFICQYNGKIQCIDPNMTNSPDCRKCVHNNTINADVRETGGMPGLEFLYVYICKFLKNSLKIISKTKTT